MTFIPPRVGISNITQALPAVVTTDGDHDLTTGQVVRLHVPRNYGMYPLNQHIFSITVLSDTTFSLQETQVPPAVNIDSTNFPAFVIPSNPQFTAEVLAVGSGPTPNLATQSSTTNNECISKFEDATTNNSTVEIPF